MNNNYNNKKYNVVNIFHIHPNNLIRTKITFPLHTLRRSEAITFNFHGFYQFHTKIKMITKIILRMIMKVTMNDENNIKY